MTDAEGQYVFSNDPRLPNSPSEVNGVYGLTPDASYVVRLDNPANYQPGGPLAGFDLTQGLRRDPIPTWTRRAPSSTAS